MKIPQKFPYSNQNIITEDKTLFSISKKVIEILAGYVLVDRLFTTYNL